VTLARRVAAPLLALIAVAAFSLSAASLVVTKTVLDTAAIARDAVAVLETPAGVVLVTDVAAPRVLADLQRRGLSTSSSTQDRIRAAIALSLAEPRVADALRVALEQMQRGVASQHDSRPVFLDLAPLNAPVQSALVTSSPRLAALVAQHPITMGTLSLGDSTSVRAARRLLQSAPTLRRIPLAAFLVGFAAALLALLVAPRRRWLLIGSGGGLVMAALVVSAAGLAAPSIVRNGVPPAAAGVASDLARRAFAGWWQAALLLAAVGLGSIAAGLVARR
jgi:hypothetical protein